MCIKVHLSLHIFASYFWLQVMKNNVRVYVHNAHICKSLIDASPMDGIMSIRMSAGGTDYMNGDNLIRWTEVFLLPCVLVTCFHES